MDEQTALRDTVTAALVDAGAAVRVRVVRVVPSWPPVRAMARWVEQARVVAVRLARPPCGNLVNRGDVWVEAAGVPGRWCVRGEGSRTWLC